MTMLGKNHSEVTKLKMSEKRKRRKFTNEHKNNLSFGIRNSLRYIKGIQSRSYKHTQEFKEKVSKRHKGKIVSEESKKRMSKSMKGRIPYNKGKKRLYKHTEG